MRCFHHKGVSCFVGVTGRWQCRFCNPVAWRQRTASLITVPRKVVPIRVDDDGFSYVPRHKNYRCRPKRHHASRVAGRVKRQPIVIDWEGSEESRPKRVQSTVSALISNKNKKKSPNSVPVFDDSVSLTDISNQILFFVIYYGRSIKIYKNQKQREKLFEKARDVAHSVYRHSAETVWEDECSDVEEEKGVIETTEVLMMRRERWKRVSRGAALRALAKRRQANEVKIRKPSLLDNKIKVAAPSATIKLSNESANAADVSVEKRDVMVGGVGDCWKQLGWFPISRWEIFGVFLFAISIFLLANENYQLFPMEVTWVTGIIGLLALMISNAIPFNRKTAREVMEMGMKVGCRDPRTRIMVNYDDDGDVHIFAVLLEIDNKLCVTPGRSAGDLNVATTRLEATHNYKAIKAGDEKKLMYKMTHDEFIEFLRKTIEVRGDVVVGAESSGRRKKTKAVSNVPDPNIGILYGVDKMAEDIAARIVERSRDVHLPDKISWRPTFGTHPQAPDNLENMPSVDLSQPGDVIVNPPVQPPISDIPPIGSEPIVITPSPTVPPVDHLPPIDPDFSGHVHSAAAQHATNQAIDGLGPIVIPSEPIIPDFTYVIPDAVKHAAEILGGAGLLATDVIKSVASGATDVIPFVMPALRLYAFATAEARSAHNSSKTISDVVFGDAPRVLQKKDELVEKVFERLYEGGACRYVSSDPYIEQIATEYTFDDSTLIGGTLAEKAEEDVELRLRNVDGGRVRIHVPHNISEHDAAALRAAFPRYYLRRCECDHPHGVAQVVRNVMMAEMGRQMTHMELQRCVGVGLSPQQVTILPNIVHNCGPELSGRDILRHRSTYGKQLSEAFGKINCKHKFEDCMFAAHADLTLALYSAHDIHCVDFAKSMIRNGSERAWLLLNLPVPFLDPRIDSYEDRENGFIYQKTGGKIKMYFERSASAGYVSDEKATMSWLQPPPRIKGYHVMIEERMRYGTTYWLELTVVEGEHEVTPRRHTLGEPFVSLPLLKPGWQLEKGQSTFFAVPSRRFRALVTFLFTAADGKATFMVGANKLRGQLAEVRIGNKTIENRLDLTVPQFYSFVAHALISVRMGKDNLSGTVPRINSMLDREQQLHSTNFIVRYQRYVRDLFSLKLTKTDELTQVSLWERFLNHLTMNDLRQVDGFDPYEDANAFFVCEQVGEIDSPNVLTDIKRAVTYAEHYAIVANRWYNQGIKAVGNVGLRNFTAAQATVQKRLAGQRQNIAKRLKREFEEAVDYGAKLRRLQAERGLADGSTQRLLADRPKVSYESKVDVVNNMRREKPVSSPLEEANKSEFAAFLRERHKVSDNPKGFVYGRPRPVWPNELEDEEDVAVDDSRVDKVFDWTEPDDKIDRGPRLLEIERLGDAPFNEGDMTSTAFIPGVRKGKGNAMYYLNVDYIDPGGPSGISVDEKWPDPVVVADEVVVADDKEKTTSSVKSEKNVAVMSPEESKEKSAHREPAKETKVGDPSTVMADPPPAVDASGFAEEANPSTTNPIVATTNDADCPYRLFYRGQHFATRFDTEMDESIDPGELHSGYSADANVDAKIQRILEDDFREVMPSCRQMAVVEAALSLDEPRRLLRDGIDIEFEVERAPEELQELIREAYSSRRMDDPFEIAQPSLVLTGVPGSGKSTLIRKCLEKRKGVLVVVPTRKLAVEWSKLMPDATVRTQHKNKPVKNCNFVVIDEFLNLTMNALDAWLNFAAEHEARVILLGDPYQQVDPDGYCYDVSDKMFNMRRLDMRISRTVPRDAWRILVKLNNWDSTYVTASKVASSIRVGRADRRQKPKNLPLELFFQKESTRSSRRGSYSIGEAQGSRVTDCYFYVQEKHELKTLAKYRGLFTVLLSRHSKRLYIITENTEDMRTLAEFLELKRAKFVDGIGRGIADRHRYPNELDYETFIFDLPEEVIDAPVSGDRLHVAEFVRTLRVKEEEFAAHMPAEVTPPTENEIQDFVNGLTNFDSFKEHDHALDHHFEPGHALKMAGEVSDLISFTDVRSGFESAHKLAEIQQGNDRAADLWNIALRQCITSKRAKSMKEASVGGEKVFRRFMEAFAAKSAKFHVGLQDFGEEWIVRRSSAFLKRSLQNVFAEDAMSVSFSAFLKTQVKAKAVPGYSAQKNYGQQVIQNEPAYSYQMAEASSMAFTRFKDILRRGVVADYGYTNAELARIMRDLGFPEKMARRNMQIDVSRQDSSHTPEIVYAFCLLLEFLGVDRDVCDLYFAMRASYFVRSLAPNLYIAQLGFNLPSGDPFTLLANIFQMLSVIACRFADADKIYIVQKGDDALIDRHLKTKHALAAEKFISVVELKIAFDLPPYHAGRFYNGHRLLTDPVRRTLKHLVRLSSETPVGELYEGFMQEHTDYSEDEIEYLKAAIPYHYTDYSAEQVDFLIRMSAALRSREFFYRTQSARAPKMEVFQSKTDCAAFIARKFLKRSSEEAKSCRGLTADELYDLMSRWTKDIYRIHEHEMFLYNGSGIYITDTHCYAVRSVTKELSGLLSLFSYSFKGRRNS